MNLTEKKWSLYGFIPVAAGALILLSVSIYNRYCLVYFDTGTYLDSGFERYIPFDRPVTYGLFVRAASLKESLWFVVVVQNIITSFVLYQLVGLFLTGKKKIITFLSVVALLTISTRIAWYSNQIMPDFFTPVFIILLFILLFDTDRGILKTLLYYCLLVISLVVHFSHLMTALMIIILFGACDLFFSRKQMHEVFSKKLRRLAILAAMIISAWIILPGINYMIEGKFILSKGSHGFLVAHLVDTGILKKFLDEKCLTEEYSDCRLCNYRDSLPQSSAEFLWGPGKYFAKTGGWTESREEYRKIIRGTLTDPKYLSQNITKSFLYGCRQLTQFEIGKGLTPYLQGSAAYGQIHWRFNKELTQYERSRQNSQENWMKVFIPVNIAQRMLVILSLLVALILLLSPLRKKIKDLSVKLLLFIFVAIILNAFITAGLSAISERFQGRVIWLLPMAVFIVILSESHLLTAFRNFAKRKKMIFVRNITQSKQAI